MGMCMSTPPLSDQRVPIMHNLTKNTVERLELSPKTYICWDQKLSGFGVKISPTGRKSYILKYRNTAGVQRKPTIGVHGQITCEQARQIAQQWMALIAQGKDPMDERHQKKAEIAFGDLFDIYLKRHAKPHKKSWKYDEEQYGRHIAPRIGNKKLSAITQQDIANLHAKLAEESGKATANHILSLITAIYNKAIEWGYFQQQSPTRFIKKFREKSRDRFIQLEELPRFQQALAEEKSEILRDFIHMLLLTGQRKSNVLSMRWGEISFSRKEWHIPETKNGESHTVPLVPDALSILERRKAQSESPFVFPGEGASGHLRDPKRAWHRLLKRADIKDLTMHDLRRTFGSYLAINGASPFIIGKALGHKNIKSTQVYARLNLGAIREQMEQANSIMKPPAEISHEKSSRT